MFASNSLLLSTNIVFLDNCCDNCKDCKSYENRYCLFYRLSCCLSNNYIFYIIVNFIYILIKRLDICIYRNNIVDLDLLLLFWSSLIVTIFCILFNCAFAIARYFNNCVDILKAKEISSSRLRFCLFRSSYSIFFVFCFDKILFSFDDARFINV